MESKKQNQETKLTDTENRWLVARDGNRGYAKWVKVVKRCKLPVIK